MHSDNADDRSADPCSCFARAESAKRKSLIDRDDRERSLSVAPARRRPSDAGARDTGVRHDDDDAAFRPARRRERLARRRVTDSAISGSRRQLSYLWVAPSTIVGCPAGRGAPAPSRRRTGPSRSVTPPPDSSRKAPDGSPFDVRSGRVLFRFRS